MTFVPTPHRIPLRAALASTLLTLGACAHCGDPAGTALQKATGEATRAACPAGSLRTARGHCVPEAWHCSPTYYGSGDGCDCNCGVPDPDCARAEGPHWCVVAGEAAAVDGCAACAGEVGARRPQAASSGPVPKG